MAPDALLITDEEECKALVEPYEGDDFSRMPAILSTDLLFRVYGANIGNVFYIRRHNLDPNAISDVIVQIRVCVL
jgi:DNA-directed RNA polymerase subunit H (RpoH/RPB5)